MVPLFIPTPVHAAIAQPDVSFQINQVDVYRHALELNDQLYLVDFTVDYAVNPTEGDLTELFIGRLLNGAAELRARAPYAFEDDGYARGIFTIYFSAPDVVDLGMTWDPAVSYTIRLEENPSLDWTGGPDHRETSGFFLWYDGGTVAATQTRLLSRFRALATLLENAWIRDLIETVAGELKLTADGEEYFENTIADVRTMTPELFVAILTAAIFEEDVQVDDGYTGGDNTEEDVMGEWLWGQTFTASGGYDMTGARFRLLREGSPGTLTLHMRATSGGFPTGADLATGTINANTFTTDAGGQFEEIAFAADYTVVTDTVYVLYLDDNAGDSSNLVQWREDSSGNYAGGNVIESPASIMIIQSPGIISIPTIGPSATYTTLDIAALNWTAHVAADFMFATSGASISSTLYADSLEDRLLGTTFDMTNLATAINVSRMWLSSVIWLIISAFMAWGVTKVAGSTKIALPVILVMMPVGALAGFLSPLVAIVAAFMSAVVLAYVFFYKGAP